MAEQISKLEEEQENLNLYSRRDCLEFHGIPEMLGENTDDLVKRIGDLIEVEVLSTDISTSHRLPSKRGQTRPIIAKFTRRNIRDNVYHQKGNLKNFNSSNLGFTHPTNNLYINESLTPKAKDLFYKVREFRKIHNFKYVWTRYGKTHLKKEDAATTKSFASLIDFEKFRTHYVSTHSP